MSVFRDGLFVRKVALDPGGGTGIGRRIAEALARHGASVAIVSRKQSEPTLAAERSPRQRVVAVYSLWPTSANPRPSIRPSIES